MGVRNKKSNDLFFGIMQSPQSTLPKETLLMDIILYLLQFIQYQHKQICWLLNFICRYIPLKQWAFDDSHSPKYQKFKVDELPVIKTFVKQHTSCHGVC